MTDARPATTARWTAAATCVLALALVAPWPDDWDAVGFVRAVTDFDLARFQPHPPGYPVYVALCRALNVLLRDPVRACGAASALGFALTVAALGRARNAPRAVAAACLCVASPELVLAGTSARSDALGVGLVALATALGASASTARQGALAGALLALGAGARPSLAVWVATMLALAVIHHRSRPRVVVAGVASFGLVCLAWTAGLMLAGGGPDALVQVTRRQLTGHFTDWGGSALTRPDARERLTALARGIFQNGMGISPSLAGALRLCVWASLLAYGGRALGRRVGWVLGATLPYAVYAAVAQNIIESPRHLLPVVVAVILVAAAGAERLFTRSQTPAYARWCALAAVTTALTVPSLETAWVHRTREPPGVAMGRWVLAQSPRERLMLFGGRSARVAEWAGCPALPRTLMGEVDVTLERFDRLPRAVFVTSEVRGRERGRGTLGPGRAFCRDARVDHAGACVTAFRYDILRPRVAGR